VAPHPAAGVPAAAPRPADGPVRLFVGGLPPEAEDSDLRSHFSQYGELLEAQVIKDRSTGRSRNFGFVMLSAGNKKEQVLLESHEICGRRVSVRLHQDMGAAGVSEVSSVQPATSGDQEPKKVFIGRLEPNFTIEMLKGRFSERFGQVSDVFLANGKKFGFVTFEQAVSASAALGAGHIDVDGVSVVIKSADPVKSGGRDRGERDRSPPPAGGAAAAYGAYPYGAYGCAYGAPQFPGYPPPGYYPGYPPPAFPAAGYAGYAAPGYFAPGYGAYAGYPAYGGCYGYYPQTQPAAAEMAGTAPSYAPASSPPDTSAQVRPY